MNFGYLYGDPKGRISRKTWWLGAIGLFVIQALVGMVVGSFAALAGLGESAFGIGLLSLILVAVFAWPSYALTAKRLNDRNRPWTLFFVFYAPSVVDALLKMLGLSGSIETVEMFGQTAPMFQPNALGQAVNAFVGVIGIWALVELGFLKGDRGPNPHGPDPLAMGASAR